MNQEERNITYTKVINFFVKAKTEFDSIKTPDNIKIYASLLGYYNELIKPHLDGKIPQKTFLSSTGIWKTLIIHGADKIKEYADVPSALLPLTKALDFLTTAYAHVKVMSESEKKPQLIKKSSVITPVVAAAQQPLLTKKREPPVAKKREPSAELRKPSAELRKSITSEEQPLSQYSPVVGSPQSILRPSFSQSTTSPSFITAEIPPTSTTSTTAPKFSTTSTTSTTATKLTTTSTTSTTTKQEGEVKITVKPPQITGKVTRVEKIEGGVAQEQNKQYFPPKIHAKLHWVYTELKKGIVTKRDVYVEDNSVMPLSGFIVNAKYADKTGKITSESRIKVIKQDYPQSLGEIYNLIKSGKADRIVLDN